LKFKHFDVGTMNNRGGDGMGCFEVKVRTDATAKFTNMKIAAYRQESIFGWRNKFVEDKTHDKTTTKSKISWKRKYSIVKNSSNLRSHSMKVTKNGIRLDVGKFSFSNRLVNE